MAWRFRRRRPCSSNHGEHGRSRRQATGISRVLVVRSVHGIRLQPDSRHFAFIRGIRLQPIPTAPHRAARRAVRAMIEACLYAPCSRVPSGRPSCGFRFQAEDLAEPRCCCGLSPELTWVGARESPGSGGRTALRRRRRPLNARVAPRYRPVTRYDEPASRRRSTALVPTGFSRGQAIRVGLTSARASRPPTQMSSGVSRNPREILRQRLRSSRS
jgi:hypothetical protein